MNFDRLQNKQGIMRSFDCPSTHFSSLNPRDSALSTQVSALCIHQSRQHPELSPQHSPQSPSINPQQLFIEMSTDLLRQGQSVRFRAPGLSMHPAIKEGEIITVVPISSLDIKRGDILLYLAGRKVVAHRVVSIKRGKNDPTSHPAASLSTQSPTQSPSHSLASFATRIKTQSTAHSTANASTYSSIQASIHSKELNPQPIFLLRGDASLTCDDPVEAQQVLGKVVSVERGSRSIDLYSRRARMLRTAHAWVFRLKRWMIRYFLQVGGFFH